MSMHVKSKVIHLVSFFEPASNLIHCGAGEQLKLQGEPTLGFKEIQMS